MSQALKKSDLIAVETRMKELGLTPEDVTRETGYALSLINGSSGLQKCSKQSVLASVIAAASTGLTLNPSVQHACLIPRYTRDGMVCEFQPMYRGLMFLAVKEGAATKFNVQAVHEKDEFMAEPDNDRQPVTHRFKSFDRGATIGYYSVATMLDGTKTAEFMSVAEIHEVRGKSDGYGAFKAGKIKTTPWAENESEMARKTVVKRHVKRLPSGKADSALYHAIDLDNREYTIETVEVAPVEDSKAVLTPDHEKWADCIAALNGGYKMSQIQKRFTVSADVQKQLLEAATEASLKQTVES